MGQYSSLKYLSVWDLNAFPEYVTVVLNFPLDNESARDATDHIRNCLSKLSADFPELSGDLRPREGWMGDQLFSNGTRHQGQNEASGCAANRGAPSYFKADSDQIKFRELVLHVNSGLEIPFDSVHGEHGFGMSYSELKQRGFPASVFGHPLFALERHNPRGYDTEGWKPLRFKAVIIEGGLLLTVHIHHSMMDGDCMRMVFEYLSALTRRERPPRLPSQTNLRLPKPAGDFMQRLDAAESISDRIRLCPECRLLADRRPLGQDGPWPKALPSNQISGDSAVRVFSFRNEQLRKLQDMLTLSESGGPPSTFNCLSALVWAHTTKARIAAQGTENLGDDIARLVVPVNWKRRAFQSLVGDYFGNACVLAETKIPLAQLLLACDSDEELKRVAQKIRASIDAVDEDFVAQRNAMMESLPSLERLGLHVDPRKPHNLSVNIWRHFGAKTVWDIPGVGFQSFDAIRRGMGQTKVGNVVVLPGSMGADTQELQIALSADAMDVLCRDERWLHHVERLIL